MAEEKLTKIDISKLRAGGFIKENGRDEFTVRLRVPGGRLPVSRLRKIVEVAEKYSGDFVHITVRQAVELVHVKFGDFDKVSAELEQAGQKVASCGARVRVPVACGGCEYNPNGLVDTQRSALELDEKLFGVNTGLGKFKVSFSGCPNDCPKSTSNDVGFVGVVWPRLEKDSCIGCGLCAKSCTEGAVTLDAEKRPVFHPEKCLYCGDCVKVCPTESWKAEKAGYAVYVGGKWGRRPMVGTLIAVFLPEEKTTEFTADVLRWYQESAEGKGKVRLGETVIAKGADALIAALRGKYGEYLVSEAENPTVIKIQTAATEEVKK